MNCKEIQSNLMELAAGEKVSALVSQHVQACNVCAVELNELRSTLSLLDEWQAPADVSPYFMTRLRACLREESAAPARASQPMAQSMAKASGDDSAWQEF